MNCMVGDDCLIESIVVLGLTLLLDFLGLLDGSKLGKRMVYGLRSTVAFLNKSASGISKCGNLLLVSIAPETESPP